MYLYMFIYFLFYTWETLWVLKVYQHLNDVDESHWGCMKKVIITSARFVFYGMVAAVVLYYILIPLDLEVSLSTSSIITNFIKAVDLICSIILCIACCKLLLVKKETVWHYVKQVLIPSLAISLYLLVLFVSMSSLLPYVWIVIPDNDFFTMVSSGTAVLVIALSIFTTIVIWVPLLFIVIYKQYQNITGTPWNKVKKTLASILIIVLYVTISITTLNYIIEFWDNTTYLLGLLTIALLIEMLFLAKKPLAKLFEWLDLIEWSSIWYNDPAAKYFGLFRWLMRALMVIPAVRVIYVGLGKLYDFIMTRYPHGKFSGEVDASFVMTMGSFATISLTLIVTFYFNRQTQLAMIEQSRSNLRERVIEKRLTLYPHLDQVLTQIVKCYSDIATPAGLDDWRERLMELRKMFDEHKYYFSITLRRQVEEILQNCEAIYISAVRGIDKTDPAVSVRLDDMYRTCKQEIEKSLDLAELVDLDV